MNKLILPVVEALHNFVPGRDYIGIVPKFESIRYAWHYFPKEFNVADCVYLSSFKEAETSAYPINKIKRLISWFPLPTVRVR